MATLKKSGDDALLSLLKEGGPEAFSQIYDRYWPDLYNAAYKRTRHKAQCQDIVQNVLADLWIRRHTLQVDNLSAYLHTAVRFQLYKQATRQPGNAFHLDDFEEVINSPIHADDPLLEKEIATLVDLWLKALPERRRQIFLLYYMEELSTREIAQRLDISQNTVQSQLYTATQTMRARLAHFLTLSVLITLITK